MNVGSSQTANLEGCDRVAPIEKLFEDAELKKRQASNVQAIATSGGLV